MKVIATYNIKGGVGKTAAAVNLGYLASNEGLRTLVWDLDPQGAATFYLRGENAISRDLDDLLDKKRGLRSAVTPTDYPRLDLLPSSLAYRNLDIALSELKNPHKRIAKLLGALAEDYDLALLDCAPSLSNASESIFESADWLLVPIIPTPLSIRAYEQLQHHPLLAGAGAGKLLPFFSMVDRRRQLHCDLVTQFAGMHPEVLRSFVPYSSQVEKMGVTRAPLGVFAPTSPGARAFAALWETVRARVGLPAASTHA